MYFNARGMDPKLDFAAQEISERCGGRSVILKYKAVHKFGSSTNIDTGTIATITRLPVYNETLLTTNGITHVISSSGSDTGVMTVEGHVVTNGLLRFVVQNVTLTGQTAAPLTIPLARTSRAYMLTAANVGTISIYEGGATTGGVPDTPAEVHGIIVADKGQTEKAATSLSFNDFGVVTNWRASIAKGSGASPKVELYFETKKYGTTAWRVRDEAYIDGANASTTNQRFFEPYFVISGNRDIRIRADTSVNDTFANASFDFFVMNVPNLQTAV